MLDEVDTLHVERNTFSGDELLSYIGFLVDSFESQKHHLICSLWSVAKVLKFCCYTYTSLGHVCSLSMINYVWSTGYRLLLLQFHIIRRFFRILLAVISVLGSNMLNICS
jgi:hypothetical protein